MRYATVLFATLSVAACGGASAGGRSVVTLPVLATVTPGQGSSAPETPAMQAPPLAEDLALVSVVGVSRKQDGGAAVLLTEDQRIVVPIYIGGTEAMSIQLRFEKRRYQRPLTHDLLDNIMHDLGGELVRVQVDDLRNNTFIATILIRREGRFFQLDARPSDAIALALGNKVPIYAARAVIKEAGVPREEFEGGEELPSGSP
jgi:bifunctional DNase/RNase